MKKNNDKATIKFHLIKDNGPGMFAGGYPFGSCQYVPVMNAYKAAKQVGIENLKALFEDDIFDQTMKLKGNHKQIMHQYKVAVMQSELRIKEGDDQEYLWQLCDVSIALGELHKELTPDNFYWKEWAEDKPWDWDEFKEILKWKSPDDAYKYMADHSWDLWSAVNISAFPKHVEGDSAQTGVELAMAEYLWEDTIDFNEWST